MERTEGLGEGEIARVDDRGLGEGVGIGRAAWRDAEHGEELAVDDRDLREEGGAERPGCGSASGGSMTGDSGALGSGADERDADVGLVDHLDDLVGRALTSRTMPGTTMSRLMEPDSKRAWPARSGALPRPSCWPR